MSSYRKAITMTMRPIHSSAPSLLSCSDEIRLITTMLAAAAMTVPCQKMISQNDTKIASSESPFSIHISLSLASLLSSFLYFGRLQNFLRVVWTANRIDHTPMIIRYRTGSRSHLLLIRLTINQVANRTNPQVIVNTLVSRFAKAHTNTHSCRV